MCGGGAGAEGCRPPPSINAPVCFLQSTAHDGSHRGSTCLCAPTTNSALSLARPSPPPHGHLPCPLAVGCISNTPSQPAVSGSGSASSSCFCVLFPCAQVCFLCAPSVSYIIASALCSCYPVFWFPSSPVQCSSVLACACLLSGLSGSALIGLAGLIRQVPRRCGGNQ